MKLMAASSLLATLFLAGCGGGSGSAPSPGPSSTYALQISITPPVQNSNNSSLAYGSDAQATVTITGGNVSDADYPTHIQLTSTDPNIMIEDNNDCLSSDAHQTTCQFTIHNIDAGPNASSALSDSIQVQAISNNAAILSNQVPLTLLGYASQCTDVFCLIDGTLLAHDSSGPSFNVPGLHHTGIEYVLQLSIGNPAKASAPSDAGIIGSSVQIACASHDLGLLDTSCTPDGKSCTLTVQNQNIGSQAKTDSITAFALLTGQTTGQAPTQSPAIALELPAVESCKVEANRAGPDDGLSLQTGHLSAYQDGTALTAYTQQGVDGMYPVALGADPIVGHYLALRVQGTPALFAPGAKFSIPGVTSSDTSLENTDCSQDYNNGQVSPFTPAGVTPSDSTTQQCYSNQQIRYVYYAAPQGVPPSKNGWPVVIMLQGSDGQDPASGYYFNPPTSNPIQGSATANVFSNSWDWSSWETDPSNPSGLNHRSLYSYSYYVRMRLIQTWLSRGFAVVVPTTWNAGDYDWWGFEPTNAQPWPYSTYGSGSNSWEYPTSLSMNSAITYLTMAYWPGMDGQFFETLMSYINDPNAYDPNAGSLKFDTHNLFLMGYSAGGNMVSRLINEFPSMSYVDHATGQSQPFPKIKGAIILSGGSYSCYEGGTTTQGTDTCPIDPVTGVGALEENYQSAGMIKLHPPTLVAQSLHDDNAGPTTPDQTALAGSVYYQGYQSLCPYSSSPSSCQSKNGGINGGTGSTYQEGNLIQMIHTANPNIYHYYFPEMVIPSLNLMLNNTCVAKVDQ